MTATAPADARSRRATFPSLQWWIRDRSGRVVVAQPPNAAIGVWLVATALVWTDLLDDRRETILSRVGQGALLVWGLDELLRGASPVRRVLGGVVLVGVLVRLFA